MIEKVKWEELKPLLQRYGKVETARLVGWLIIDITRREDIGTIAYWIGRLTLSLYHLKHLAERSRTALGDYLERNAFEKENIKRYLGNILDLLERYHIIEKKEHIT